MSPNDLLDYFFATEHLRDDMQGSQPGTADESQTSQV